jgi:hypothetical protein
MRGLFEHLKNRSLLGDSDIERFKYSKTYYPNFEMRDDIISSVYENTEYFFKNIKKKVPTVKDNELRDYLFSIEHLFYRYTCDSIDEN